MVEGVIYRYRCGIAWRDAAGLVGWVVSADSTIARAHQHATAITRPTVDGSGAVSNYTNLIDPLAEPADHAIGRSRGG